MRELSEGDSVHLIKVLRTALKEFITKYIYTEYRIYLNLNLKNFFLKKNLSLGYLTAYKVNYSLQQSLNNPKNYVVYNLKSLRECFFLSSKIHYT